MAAPSAILAPKEAVGEKKKPERELLPFLSFLTFSPIGNPLERMSAFQRQFFLESVFRMLHVHRVEDQARTGALLAGKGAQVSAVVAGIAAMRNEAERQKATQLMVEKRAGNGDGAGGAGPGKEDEAGGAGDRGPARSGQKAGLPQSAVFKAGAGKEDEAGGAGDRGPARSAQKAGLPQSAVFGAMPAETWAAAEKLSQVLGDYSRGDENKAKAAMAEFESRLKAQNYGAEDLMAVLLLVIEDKIWAGEEGGIGGTKPSGSSMRVSSIPGKLRESAKDSAEVRLASVREMIRHYFDQHPGEYGPARSGQKAGLPQSAVFGAMPAETWAAAEKLSQVLGDYSRGDENKAKAAMAEFESRLKAQNYGAEDLMAVLLLVIEDKIWAGEEGGIGGTKPSGSSMRVSSIPGKLRESAKDSAEVRLASVREMIRHYFDQHPGEYGPARSGQKAGLPQSAVFKAGAGKEDEAGGAGDRGPARSAQKAGLPQSAVFGAMPAETWAAAEKLSQVLGDYSRGDENKAKAAMAEFESRLKAQNYGAEDLMAVLLLVIEDKIWAGEEGGIGGTKPSGSSMRVSSIPGKLRESAKDSAEVRLASVREMIRHYFDQHPGEYGPILAAALGITSDQEEDVQFLQERLAFELASIGSFALSQKMLSKIKEQRKMGTKKCLLELGYVYDGKKKKLILGKRTCGTPVEAKGVIGLLVGSLRGKAKLPRKGASQARS